MIFEKMSLKKKMLAGGIVPMVLLVILGITSFQSINALLSIGKKVNQTNEIIGQLGRIKNTVSELQHTENDFLVTGNADYLELLSEMKKKLALMISGLKEKVNAEQGERLGSLESLLSTWYQEADKEILARKKIDMTGEERKAIREQSGETLSLKVEDIVDPAVLRDFQKYYDGATGVSNLVVEKDGTPVKLQGYDEFQEFCFGYQRKNKKGLERCMKSDAQGPQDAKKAGRSWYYCYSGGLIDFGFPITVDGEQIGNWLGGQILLESPDEAKFRQQAADIGIEDTEGYINALKNVPIVPEDKLEAAIELLKAISSTFSRMGNDLYLRNKLVEIVDEGKAKGAMSRIVSLLDEIRETELILLNARQISAEKAAGTTKSIIWIATVITVLFSLTTAVLMTRGLLHQLGRDPFVIEKIAGQVSEGDLTPDFSSGRKNESGVFAAMKKMVENLKKIIADVKSASDSLAITSRELSARSEELSQGASEQAASAEQVSASMEEMNATIRQNADNASVTEKIALKSARDAKAGEKAFIKTVTAMRTISEKILVIQEIAQQTNMLALNAAIEAARAGVQGKGFAVVAYEVRDLSKQTQKSAKEIIELAQSSVEIAENAGQLLAQVVPDIQKTAELVQEIAVSSSEQNAGADQINRAVQQLDQTIQQNAALSEEIAATSDKLARQAEQLRRVTKFFKTEDISQKTEANPELKSENILPEDIEKIRVILAKFDREDSPQQKEIGSAAMKKETIKTENLLGRTGDKYDSEFEVY
jgi:methyl-accepting chemotaxis protein